MARAVDTGLFGPRSVSWKVNREQVMLLGGGCALLLQIAHPLVAAGVAGHSSFKADPMRRLRRTLDATLAIIFGTTEEAERAAAGVRAVHARVRGELPEAVGPFAAGTRYDAQDPELLLWVHATLVDASIRSYRLFVDEFRPGEVDRYYEETKVAARILGVPDDLIPPTLEDFDRYVARVLAGPSITIGETARDLAQHVLYPSLRFPPKAAFRWAAILTVGLLPEEARATYGFRWDAARERRFRRRSSLVRQTIRLLPPSARLFPQARSAERRLRTEPAGR